MKQILFLAAGLFTAGTLTAQQLPNNGFEDWHPFYDTEAPDYWVGTNQMVIAGASPGIDPTTDAHSGNYAARFSTIVLDLFGEEVLYPSAMYINSTPETDDEGTPFTGRPDSLVAWVKYLPGGQNQFLIRADLLKYNSVSQEVEMIGTAGYIGVETGNTYTRIAFPFTYTSPETPDTLTLIISSSIFEPTLANTVLVVDDLILVTNGPAGAPELTAASIEIAPNPASDVVNVRCEEPLSHIELVDLSGKTVLKVDNPGPTTQINLSELAAGTFICRVLTTDGAVYQERIIKH
ncbi:MAG: T9SS type A sorting domain-containing protein [Bacteroidota bacterium]